MTRQPRPIEIEPGSLDQPSADSAVQRAASVSLPVRETRLQTRSRLRAQESDQPGFFGTIGSALQLESSLSAAGRFMERQRYTDIDPNWNGVFLMPRQEQDEFLEGIPPAYWDALIRTNSREHAIVVAEQLRKRARTEQRLAEAGVGGLVARIGSAMLDPGNLIIGAGATLAIGPVGTAGVLVNRGDRIRRAMHVGGAAAAANVLVDSVVFSDDPTRGVNDMLVSAVAGFAVGFGGSAALQTARARMAGRVESRIADDEIHQAIVSGSRITISGELTDTARYERLLRRHTDGVDPRFAALLARQTGADREYRLLQQHVAGADVRYQRLLRQHVEGINDASDLTRTPLAYTGSRFERVPSTDPVTWSRNTGSDDVAEIYWHISNELNGFTAPIDDPFSDIPLNAMGAAAARGMEFTPEGLQGTDFRLTGLLNDAPSSMSAWRFGFSGRGGADDLPPEARAAFNGLVRDPVLKRDGRTQYASAIEHKNMVESRMMGQAMSTWMQNFKGWRAENVTGARRMLFAGTDIKSNAEFGRQVTRSMREGGIGNRYVDDTAAAISQAFDDALEFAVRHGVRGAADIQHASNFVPRAWSAARMHQAITQHGEQNVVRAIAQSMQRGWTKELSDEDALLYARMLMRVAMNPERYNSFDQLRLMHGRNMDFIHATIRSEVADGAIKADAGERLINAMRSKIPSEGAPQPLRNRTTMDELFELDLPTGKLRIEDMLNNHAGELLNGYVRSMVGAGVRDEYLRAMSQFAKTDFASTDDLISHVGSRMAAANLPQSRINSTAMRLQALTDIMQNRRSTSTFDAGQEYDKMFRVLRDIQTARLSGLFAFAQIPETGFTLAQVGIRAMVQQMPAFRQTIQLAKTGKADGLVGTLATITGRMGSVGNPIFARALDIDPESAITGAERISRATGRSAFLLSGQSAMMDMQTAMSSAAATQRLVNLARSGKKVGRARMAALGWDEKMSDRIMTELKESAVMGPRGSVVDIDMSRWQDLEALSHFANGMRRWAGSAIQADTLGAMTPFMQSQIGKTVIQFRSFVIGAYENHLLNGVAMARQGDFSHVMGWAYATFIAANAYIAQQYISNAGRSDFAEIMEDRLSLDNIATAAVQRAGYSAFLPDIANLMWSMGGGDGVPFGHRHTGLTTLSLDGLFGNPTTDMLSSSARSISDAAGAVWGDDYGAEELRRAFRLLPFHRLPYVSGILDALAEGLTPD